MRGSAGPDKRRRHGTEPPVGAPVAAPASTRWSAAAQQAQGQLQAGAGGGGGDWGQSAVAAAPARGSGWGAAQPEPRAPQPSSGGWGASGPPPLPQHPHPHHQHPPQQQPPPSRTTSLADRLFGPVCSADGVDDPSRGAALPIAAHREEILSLIASNQVIIVTGETGSGKTTQVPQYILDKWPRSSIIVTQPRRIAATSIARRVAGEMNGGQVGGLVGNE